MLAMFLPVNVFAAMNRVEFGGHEWGPAYLWIRVPLQAILVGWIWRFAVRPTSLEPIRFSCEATFRMAAEEIAAGILDLSKWPEFEGYGVLPGVKSATFELKTPEIVGTRIRATDRDGSTHVEEIVEWAPDRQIKLRMSDFSPPLSRIATCFEETWLFDRQDDRTQAVRQFALFPKSAVARPPLWVVAQLLKRAIARHLVQMKRSDQ
jgi:hypothetical protein